MTWFWNPHYLPNGVNAWSTDSALLLQDFVGKLHISVNKHSVVELAVSMALERHDSQREMTSRLISDLYGSFLTQGDFSTGFDNLLDSLNDLSLDTPDAANVSHSYLVIPTCKIFVDLIDSCTLNSFNTSIPSLIKFDLSLTLSGFRHVYCPICGWWLPAPKVCPRIQRQSGMPSFPVSFLVLFYICPY